MSSPVNMTDMHAIHLSGSVEDDVTQNPAGAGGVGALQEQASPPPATGSEL